MNKPFDAFVKKYFWWVFFVTLLIALFSHLDYVPLKFEEPRRGTVALEMEYSGDYLTPTINGENYYNKPPVYNWVLVGLFNIFNSHEDWVLRLPTVFCFLLLAFIHYKVVRQKLGETTAVFAALFFITSTDLLFYFSFQGEIDMFYSLLVYLQVVSIIWFFEKENYRALFLASYFLMALGILTKGLPSIAFQGITLLAFFIYYRRFRQLFNIWNFVGLGMAVIIVGGYFFLYSQHSDALPFLSRLLSESSNRTVAEKSFLESIVHLFSFPLILIDILSPWLFIAPLFFTRSLLQKAKDYKWINYIILFITSNIIIYWISPGTRDRYLYMFVPFFSALFGFMVHSYLANRNELPRVVHILLVSVMGVLILAMPVIPFVQPVSTVPKITLIASCLFLVLASILWLYLKSHTQRIYIFILFVVLARIGFNFIVMPLRLEDELRDNYKYHVDNMLEITQGAPFFFYGDMQYSEKQLPLVGTTVEYRELAYHPFQLTYYIEKQTGEIFEYANERIGDRYYLAEKNLFDRQPGRKKIHYQFTLEKRRYDFVLFEYE
ncbi:MAG: glycosyltransferase family 39 protein [Cyclobacteriaceae bacterium]